MKPLLRIAVTGGAGQVAYNLLFMIAQGDLFGLDQPIALHLIDLPDMQKCLEGVAMELEDCAFPVLKEIKVGSDAASLFSNVHYALLLGAKPRLPGMERKDLLADNGKIFAEQGKALNEASSKDTRILVVGNPCNTNCLIALHNAPKLSPKQFFAMTRLDQNRAVYQLAAKAKANVSEVKNMVIWGNHSSTQVADFVNAEIRGQKAVDAIHDRKWLEEVFFSELQKRGAEVLRLRGKSSAASAAKAAYDSIRSMLVMSQPKSWFSMGVYSEGNPYGIDEDLVFSFPCRCASPNHVEIVPHLSIDSFLKEKMLLSQKELIEEREAIKHLLG